MSCKIAPRPAMKSFVWRVSFVRGTRLIHIYNTTPSSKCPVLRIAPHPAIKSCVWRDLFVGGTRLIHMRDKTPSSKCPDLKIFPCPTTKTCMWHDLFVCGTRHIYMFDTTPSSEFLSRDHPVPHDQILYVKWFIYMWDETYSLGWHNSFIRVSRSRGHLAPK